MDWWPGGPRERHSQFLPSNLGLIKLKCWHKKKPVGTKIPHSSDRDIEEMLGHALMSRLKELNPQVRQRPSEENKEQEQTGDMAQVIEHLLSKHKALN
jgi:hypothetical protein